MLLGTVVGIIFGSIPGLTSTMGVALCLPLTFSMKPVDGIAMMIALYVGGTSGGLISAILLKIPGTPASVATTFDGAPMGERGEGGKALSVGIIYSFLGTVLSILALIFIAPSLATIALKFGPQEFFAICLFALTMIGAMVGDNLWKGLISGIAGITLSLFGIASIGGVARFTFGIQDLENGFSQLLVMIGLFAVAEVLKVAASGIKAKEGILLEYHTKGSGLTLKEFKEQFVNFIRSALIGIGIGILPGIGGATSNIIAYSVAKQQSKYPEKFGTGIIDGIVASESSNNAAIGGALIPIVEYGGIRMFVKVLAVPKYILLPAVLILCIVGTYGTNHSMFDVWTALIFGVIGYFMAKHHFPQAPLILGFVLGSTIEENLIRGLMYTNNNFWAFFESTIAAVFMLVPVGVVIWTAWKEVKKNKERKVKCA